MSTASVGNRTIWVLDPAHTVVEFSVKHMMIATVKGRFARMEGRVEADPADMSTATITATIDAASIDTQEAQRDGHLRSADFFDVENHPVITFQSKQVEKKGDNEYTLLGDLTIRGVTREVELDLAYEGHGKSPWGQEVIGFTAEGKLNRKEFNLMWNVTLETGGFLVSDQVKLTISGEAIKQG